MNAKAIRLPLCRCWLNRLLRRSPKTAPEQRKLKRHRHHGVTSFFEMP